MNLSVSALALATCASVFAGPDLDTRVCDLEKQMKQVRTETASMTYGANTASARPDVEGQGFFLSFDILYWQSRIGGTEYAYTDDSPTGVKPVNGRVKEMDFNWDWGLRAGIGYNFDHGDWDIYANFTYFTNNSSTMVTGGLNGSVIPLRGSLAVTESTANNFQFYYAQKATAQYKFQFDRVDLELGRNFFVARDLSFRPHIGLVTAWINQAETVRYTGGALLGGNTVQVKDKCDFWGIGPRAGMNSNWYLTDGFSIFGNISAALVYGQFSVTEKNWYSATPDTNIMRINASMHRFAPTAALQLGLAYDQYICNNTQHIGLRLGWDTQYWWSMNQMLRVVQGEFDYTSYARLAQDVSLQGVTFEIRWDF